MNPEHVLEVDTKGICLLCLNATDAVSAPVVTRTNGDPGDEIHRIASYRTLMRYLKINVLHLEHFATVLLQLEGLDEIPVLITMCSRCVTVMDKFSKLYKEFELIRMQMQTCLTTLYDDMTHGDKVPSRVVEYNRRMTSRQPFEIMKASFAESLRMETINKCYQKIDAHVPRVAVKRSRSPLPVIKTTTSLAPPVSNDNGRQSIDRLPKSTLLQDRVRRRVRNPPSSVPCPRSVKASMRVRDSRGKFLPKRIKREAKSNAISPTPHCSTDLDAFTPAQDVEMVGATSGAISNEDFTECLGKLESADCEVIIEESEEFQHEIFGEVNGSWEEGATMVTNNGVNIYEDYEEAVGSEGDNHEDVDGPPVLIRQVEDDHNYTDFTSPVVKKSVKKKPRPLYTRKFKCSKCSKKFGARGILQRHMRTVHAPDKSYRLEVNRAISQLFIETECTKRTPYACPYCRRKFINIGMLKIHFGQHHMDQVAVKMSEINASSDPGPFVNGQSPIEIEFNGEIVATAGADDVYFEPAGVNEAVERPPKVSKPKKIVNRMLLKCKVCFAPCKTQGQLKYHMLRDHSEPFKCEKELCTYRTLIKKRLIAHKTSTKCPILAFGTVLVTPATDSWEPLLEQ